MRSVAWLTDPFLTAVNSLQVSTAGLRATMRLSYQSRARWLAGTFVDN